MWLKFLINPSALTKEDRRKEEKERGRKNTNIHNVKTAMSRIQYKTESHPNKQKMNLVSESYQSIELYASIIEVTVFVYF